MRQTNEASFKKKYIELYLGIKDSQCWVWTATRFVRRRRQVQDKTIPVFWITDPATGLYKQVYARRWAWETTHGKLPKESQVVNLCDNQDCVRPDTRHNNVVWAGSARPNDARLVQQHGAELTRITGAVQVPKEIQVPSEEEFLKGPR